MMILMLMIIMIIDNYDDSAGANDYDDGIQATSPALVVHFASGRLAARLTPYVLLLILQVKNI